MRHSIVSARPSRRLLPLLAALWLLAAPQGTAHASPIHQHLTKYQQLLINWGPFLAKGPSFWATHKAPTFPAGVTLPMQNGLLVDTPLVDYLEWRRNLDPARFDHWHPRLGPELAQLADSPPPPCTCPPPTTPTTPTNPNAPQGLQPSPPAIPEPSSVLTAVLLFGSAACWRRRRDSRRLVLD